MGDTAPPYFVGLPYESIVITIKVDDSADPFQGTADVKVELSGLFDDLSQIKAVEILLESEDYYFWIESPDGFDFCRVNTDVKLPRDCVLMDPKKPGWYTFRTAVKLSLNYAGDYKITQVKLEDQAGNSRILRSNLGENVVPFPGTRHILEEEEKRRRAERRAYQKKKEEEEEARRKTEELENQRRAERRAEQEELDRPGKSR